MVLCERHAAPRPPVCGEFVSVAATAELAALGVAPARLEARPIARARLFVGRSATTACLPAGSYGLSRERLDQCLLELAGHRGAEVRRGTSVRALERRAGRWCAALSDRSRLECGAIVLATGKHELRGHARSTGGGREAADV